MDVSALPLHEVVAALERLYPPHTALSWDRVGLVSGDLDQLVSVVHFAVDPTLAVIDEARAAGADLLVTHHPLLLRGVHSVATTSAKGASVTSLVVNNIALYVAHTNADVASPGVCDALASACGLLDVRPLEVTNGGGSLDSMTGGGSLDSMTGGGSLGSMASGGSLGSLGSMASRGSLDSIAGGGSVGSLPHVGHGRVGTLAHPQSLREFAQHLSTVLPKAAGGIRVAGPADALVSRVAVVGGAGDDMFDVVRASGADVYVTADLRHHPALEAREEARGGTPYLVDAGHWATEWMWLRSARSELVRELGARGTSLSTHICTLRTDPWDFVIGAADSDSTSDITGGTP